MAQHSASGVRGLIRKYSSDSDSSPQKPATKKHINTNVIMEVILKDIQNKLDTVIFDQKSLRQCMEAKIDNLKKDLVTKIENESKALRDEMHIELAKMGDRVDAVEHRLSTFETELRAEVTQLKSRVVTVIPREKISLPKPRNLSPTECKCLLKLSMPNAPRHEMVVPASSKSNFLMSIQKFKFYEPN